MKIINVVGARPNFMKIASLMREYKKYAPSIRPLLVHTGQHYDEAMSKTFFRQLGIPEPDINLGVGSGSHAEQTAKIMIGFEKVISKEKPDLVLVVGDVNSTMACTLTAVKLGIKTAHVEAGLRSFDMSMPEEINRKATDCICDYLFTTEESANKNLMDEGVKLDKVFFVGNVMVDTLIHSLEKIKKLPLCIKGITDNDYATLTLHRPSNVDDPKALKNIFIALDEISKQVPVVFPIHPRTKKNLHDFGLWQKASMIRGLIITEPKGYLEFLRLNSTAKFVLTDSGGLQEETTFLGIPCLTMRKNTERPVTVSSGTNVLTGTDPGRILKEFKKIMSGSFKRGKIPALWDGRAAQRIVKVLVKK